MYISYNALIRFKRMTVTVLACVNNSQCVFENILQGFDKENLALWDRLVYLQSGTISNGFSSTVKITVFIQLTFGSFLQEGTYVSLLP